MQKRPCDCVGRLLRLSRAVDGGLSMRPLPLPCVASLAPLRARAVPVPAASRSRRALCTGAVPGGLRARGEVREGPLGEGVPSLLLRRRRAVPRDGGLRRLLAQVRPFYENGRLGKLSLIILLQTFLKTSSNAVNSTPTFNPTPPP